MRRLSKVSLLGLLAFPAACVAPSAPEPAPAPAPEPTPAPPPAEPIAPAVGWQDRATSPGDWRYRSQPDGSIAEFGTGDAVSFAIRCERSTRTIKLSVPGVLDAGKTARLMLRASDGMGAYTLANEGGTPPRVAARLAATDGLLDKIAYSRGRFLAHAEGGAEQVIPNWAEFARVVEDCRS